MKSVYIKHNSVINNYNTLLIICAFLLFVCTNPYFCWRTPLVLLSSWLVCALSYNYFSSKTEKITPFVVFVVLYIILVIKREVNFFGAMEMLVIPFFFLLKKEYIIDLYNKFIIVFAIVLVPSIVEYLFWLLGFDFGFKIIDPYEQAKAYSYQQFIFFVTSYSPFTLPRFYSYYDEPGVLGSMCAMILISKGYNLKDKYNIIILIAGILSFSFYFYAITLVAFLFSDVKHKYLWSLLVILLVFGATKIDFLEPLVNRFIFEDGKFAGDNRTNEDYDIWFNNFLRSDHVWYGYGKNFAQDINKGGSSYKDIIVNYGLAFFLLYVASFILLCFKILKKHRSRLLWVILFLSCLYQRPSLGRVEFVFIWISSMYAIGLLETEIVNDKKSRDKMNLSRIN